MIFGQTEDIVEVVSDLIKDSSVNKCKHLNIGKVIFKPAPIYPADAKSERVGGKVEIQIKLDENGDVVEIKRIEGPEILRQAATEAALKTKFSQTICDGQIAQIDALMIYDFIPYVITDDYFSPEKIEDFTDVTTDSTYYESILNITENYNLAFGYKDKKFHSNAPLTKGDFAHFLRLTLDLLLKRAAIANKNPGRTKLFYAYNPQNIRSADEIKDFNKNLPYATSVSSLILKYDIGLVGQDKKFYGKYSMTYYDVIKNWAAIFGKDAVPVNFKQFATNGQILTRGEFALFLQESLYVLTYRILP